MGRCILRCLSQIASHYNVSYVLDQLHGFIADQAHVLGKACMLIGMARSAAVQEYQAGAADVPCVWRECGYLMAVSGSACAQQAWTRA